MKDKGYYGNYDEEIDKCFVLNEIKLIFFYLIYLS
jgi:hypothetical protein